MTTGVQAPRFAHQLSLTLLIVLLWLAQLIGGATPVAAHAALGESNPAANAVPPAAPPAITPQFTERVERAESRAELHDASGAIIPGMTPREGADADEMLLDLPVGLANGTYSVLWRTLSMDNGHTARGYIPFTIGSAADVRVVVPPAPVSTSGGAPVWPGVVARWTTYLGLAVALAVWPLWLFVLRPAVAPAWQIGPWLTRRVRRLTIIGFVVTLFGSLATLGIQAADLSGGNTIFHGLTVTLSETRFGTIWLLRLGVLLLYAASLVAVGWWWPGRRRLAAVLALLLGLAAPVTFSLLSHAAAQPAGAVTAIAADALHLYAASVWAGGLIILVGTFLPTLRDLTATGQQVVLGGVIPRFSRLALIAWAVMILTGIYAAWLEVGNLAALRQTPYGQSLTVKLALIVPLLALAAFNLFWVSRGVRRSEDTGAVTRWRGRFTGAIIAETLLVALVLAVVGLLVSQPPGRDVITGAAGRLTIPLTSGEQQATLYITPGTVGPNHYQLVLGDGHNHETGRGAPPVEALLRVELPAQDTGQKQIDLAPALAGTYEGRGSELSIAGDWEISAIVRQQGQPDWSSTVAQAIGLTPLDANVPPPPPRFGPAGVVGLLLVVVGVAGLILALAPPGASVRREAAGLGLIGLVLGAILVAQGRLTAEDAAATAGQPTLVAVDPAAVERGAPLFAANRATGHGPAGKGDGPCAAQPNPPPADLTTVHAFAYPDDVYRYWIEPGIPGPGMPAFGKQLTTDPMDDVIA